MMNLNRDKLNGVLMASSMGFVLATLLVISQLIKPMYM